MDTTCTPMYTVQQHYIERSQWLILHKRIYFTFRSRVNWAGPTAGTRHGPTVDYALAGLRASSDSTRSLSELRKCDTFVYMWRLVGLSRLASHLLSYIVYGISDIRPQCQLALGNFVWLVSPGSSAHLCSMVLRVPPPEGLKTFPNRNYELQ